MQKLGGGRRGTKAQTNLDEQRGLTLDPLTYLGITGSPRWVI